MAGFAVLGTGRIGAMHAEIIARSRHSRVVWTYDAVPELAERAAALCGARWTADVDEALADDAVEAVLIASPTNTHADLIVRAARAGKAVFCEKPIDAELARVEECARQLQPYSVPIQIGFNRRFDPSHAAVETAVRAGEIGELEMLVISSRDPEPPPRPILEACGGLFRDTTIHDLDMARFILGEEPVEVYATASNLVDPMIGEVGDVDTAMVVLRTASGKLCHINNSRRATYGYDQRVEAFGSKGMVRSDNPRPTALVRYGSGGTAVRDPLLHFFIERYRDAYVREIDAFVDFLEKGGPSPVSFEDGRRALILAEAAIQSARSGVAVKVDYGVKATS
ncbi:inositol 2-dehydrogenase [Shinella sp.]|uniref:inositol 2-dehydrogenase n=1 Tax=Shinella sp. TaxID=1870904 RepID=UPI0039E6A8CA